MTAIRAELLVISVSGHALSVIGVLRCRCNVWGSAGHVHGETP